jgi:hypothetical protein
MNDFFATALGLFWMGIAAWAAFEPIGIVTLAGSGCFALGLIMFDIAKS